MCHKCYLCSPAVNIANILERMSNRVCVCDKREEDNDNELQERERERKEGRFYFALSDL